MNEIMTTLVLASTTGGAGFFVGNVYKNISNYDKKQKEIRNEALKKIWVGNPSHDGIKELREAFFDLSIYYNDDNFNLDNLEKNWKEYELNNYVMDQEIMYKRITNLHFLSKKTDKKHKKIGNTILREAETSGWPNILLAIVTLCSSVSLILLLLALIMKK